MIDMRKVSPELARKSRNPAAVTLLMLLVGAGCTGLQSTSGEPPAPDAVAELAYWMTGTFSSREQAAAMPDDYFDIRLVMQPIWTGRETGTWLYVEQAAAEALGRPYRQRVYELLANADGSFTSRVYALPGDPLDHVAPWTAPEPLADLDPADLLLREGCDIRLIRAAEERYEGSTTGRLCPSSLRGATYATSEVVVTPTELRSWDRGFDGDDLQVWGATQGAYVFRKEQAASQDADRESPAAPDAPAS